MQTRCKKNQQSKKAPFYAVFKLLGFVRFRSRALGFKEETLNLLAFPLFFFIYFTIKNIELCYTVFKKFRVKGESV